MGVIKYYETSFYKIDTEIEVEIANVVVDPGEEEENAENLVNCTGHSVPEQNNNPLVMSN